MQNMGLVPADSIQRDKKKVIGGQIFDHDRHDLAVPGSPSKPANQRTGKSELQQLLIGLAVSNVSV